MRDVGKRLAWPCRVLTWGAGLGWAALALPCHGAPPQPAAAPLAEVPELTVEALVQQVLARNPSLAQMAAAAETAAARYPQVTSLDDPTFGATLAPAGLGSQGDGSRGYRLEVSQKFPWPGK